MASFSWDDIPDKKPASKPSASFSWDDVPDKPKGRVDKLMPPPAMRDTPERARQRVLDAQAEDRQRRTAEAVKPKKDYGLVGQVGLSAPPKGTKEGQDISGSAGRQAAAAAPKPKVQPIGSKAQPMKGAAALINRAGSPLYPVADLANRIGDEIGALSRKHGRVENVPDGEMAQALIRAAKRWAPWKAFKQGLVQGKVTDLEVFRKLAAGDPALRKRLKVIGGPATADFLASIPLDAVTGRAVNKVVGGAQKAVTALKVQDRVEAALPTVGQALQGRRAYRGTAERFNLREAQQEGQLRKVGAAAEDLKTTSRMYQKKGANIRVEDPLTGRAVNKLDQLVADYQEAGARGSRHEVVSGGGNGPSIKKQQKQLQTAQAILPKRGKLAAQAQQKAAAAKGELSTAEAAAKQAQQKLQAERKAQQQAAEVARKARAQQQAAVREKAEAVTVAEQRSQSLAKLRDTQAERARKLKEAESAVPALERDAQSAAKAHNEARKRAAELENRARIAEGQAARQKNQSQGMVRRSDTPGKQTQASNAHQKAGALRAEADALRQQAKQAAENEANMLRQLQKREQEAERARAAVAQARKLTPSTGALQLARQRANAAQAAAQKAEAQAAATAAQAKQAWSGAKQAQQPVSAATREAGAARQRLFTTQKATTQAEKQAARLTQRAAGAQMKVGVLGNQLSTPVQRAGMQARRAVELREIAKEAQAHGIAFEDVKRLGEQYRGLSEELGQKLVGAGRMTPEAFERLRGFHLPRLYSLAASKPKEARKVLRELEMGGHITDDVARELERTIYNRERGISGRGAADFTEPRVVDTFAERMSPEAGRLAEGSATPAMTRYAQSATKDIAEAEAMRDVVQNPAFALPSGTGPRHWIHEVDVDDVKYQVDPGVKRYLDFRNDGDAVTALFKRHAPTATAHWQNVNKNMRQLWMSAPPSAINNAAGNYQLGASAAAINGARYHLPGYLMAAKEWKDFSKSGKASGYLDEALNQTDLLAEGGGVLPRGSREVGSGFGVETAGQRFGQGLANAKEAYQNVLLRDPEKAGRYYLYKELRASGKDVDEAARIVRAAMIDYSDVGPMKKFLDQNNILPFLTFPTKAIFQYMNLAARRPDLFQTWTGERLRDLMDSLSDESAERQGKEPTAKARREAGAVGITSFPIPGQLDSQGQPTYMRSSAMAPIAMMAPFGRPDQPMDPLQFIEERGKTALPLFRTPIEMLGNFSTFRDFKPIIEPGSVPGTLGTRDAYANPESFGALAMHGLKAFAPQVGQLERLYHAATGTTAYPGMFAQKQTVGQALLQVLTGAAVQEGTADRGKEGLERAGARAKSDSHAPFQKFTSGYIEQIEAGKVPRNPDYARKAQEITTFASAKKHLEAATKKLKDITTSDYFTGETRYKQIRMHTDWVYSLADRIKELAAKEGMMAP
jgi:hypothetical protein